MATVAALKPVSDFAELADEASLAKAKKALEANGFEVFVVNSGAEAKAKVLELIPEGAEVMTNASKTLDEIGISKEINESGRYDAIRPKMMALYGDPSKKREMRKIAAAPDFALGSVHAITEHGEVIIASASGSQLGPYPYSAGKVIWVAGTHKIVDDHDHGRRRIKEHTFPLENERAKVAYGFGSAINKELTIRGDGAPGRYTLILIREFLGF